MIQQTVRVRVATVCRNDRDGLRATVASVEAQTTPPAEHRIQDGRSTDGTAQWLESLPRASWRTVRSEPDEGIYDAMNRAMAGEWDLIVFLNSGDRFASADVLDRIVRSWRTERWAWAIGSARMLREDGSVVRTHGLRWFRWSRFISGIRSVPHQAVVLSRGLVDDVGRHRLDVGLSADQEYLLRCWLRTPPARLPFTVAECDASGISAQQAPGAFARQIESHRRALGHVILGLRPADRFVATYAIGWDSVKRRLGAALSAVRA